MKHKKPFITILMLVVMTVLYVCPVFASESLDDLSGQTQITNQQPTSAVGDYLKGREAVTAENMREAQTYISPITNIIGTLIGIIMAFTSTAIFLITALDLLYIGFPPIRPLLYPAGTAVGGAPMGGMPGMGAMGGMHGMRGMMGGGMAMGGMQGSQAMASGNSRRFISDEAIAAVALAQPASAQAPMMGSMGMGAMGAMQQPALAGGKSAIAEYFKKRVIFIIIFGACTVVLLSSILTDCGINVGMLVLKLVGKLSNSVTNVNM